MKKFVCLLACLFAFSANATLITSISSGYTTHDFLSSGAKSGSIHESGITYSSTYSSSVYGYDGNYGFLRNGRWNNMNMIGLNTSFGTMTIEFDNAVSEVLAFVNYIDGWFGNAKMSVFDSNFNLLETNTLTFRTNKSNNSGFDLGFSSDTNEIKYIQFSDQYIGVHNLRTVQVPEPSAILLLAFGLAGIGFSMKKKAT
ncbi:hypothetical protein PCNPT3_06150 [Psychromonas sp. CNPT3]|uniref:PEP-CTERM sorting domain-containing protein n=1 Tax=Psychromonas sp. CNPT3 TaxID=314282 RepID=UPI00006E9D08|nr:PEP-CTERM sorting domain-containing protein [Psychromonas sp. CNPT3]AGH81172.1 hypothetical protein PCNPT3_06150 [Psychromonas sp. CNPT3]